jgi:hypothetical protein
VWKWKSYLVETGTFLSDLREGTPEKPKFEQDLLESHSSFNHRKRNPEVLSRLSHQAGVVKISIRITKLHNSKGIKPGGVGCGKQIPQGRSRRYCMTLRLVL